ncbi:hypothetical protein M422DRAFT_219025 [Sphaerobolus stellatus SS14]|nr:hypothetical protein M422DRAFT_219025 [Sphaerobolus stellatus SS14]
MMASPLPAQSSRASSPATTISEVDFSTRDGKTIDDLTVALANFSRAQTPDITIGCCCQQENCESMRAWADVRAKLESRLVLSAEVGQALLQRYEAYVRRQDASLSREASSIFGETHEDTKQQVEILTKKLDTVTEENSLMESRIQELLIKSEMSEATMRTMQRELHDARATANKLAGQQSRSAGLESRLAQQLQERDDMRQERDAALLKEKQANAKAAIQEEKYLRLHKEVDALKEELYSLRSSRTQFSQSVLEEAKDRIDTLRHSLASFLSQDDNEAARVLEGLVIDNEALKRDIDELNTLLSDSRDELEEVRDELTELKGHDYDPFSEELDETKLGSPARVEIINSYRSGGSSGLDLDLGSQIASSSQARQSRPRTRVRGVQTDPVVIRPMISSRARSPGYLRPNFALPSPRPSTIGVDSTSSHDPQSETSSINQSDPRTYSSSSNADTPTSADFPRITSVSNTTPIMPSDPRPLATITSRVSALLTRLTQANARTLSLRLRRQNLLGDPKQISEATIKAIVSEAGSLRIGKEDSANTHAGRMVAQSYPVNWVVSRSEFKSLLRLFKDLFTELGTLRAQLNEVIFDPGLANKLSKETLEPEAPSNALTAMGPIGRGGDKDRIVSNSWMAPIQKLFGQSQALQNPHESSSRQSRLASKQAPAVAASTTTVNVEFASGGVRGTGAVHVDAGHNFMRSTITPSPAPHIHAPVPSRSLLGIFAGAPQPVPNDRWVVLPRVGTKEKDRLKQLRGSASNARLALSHSNADKAASIGRSVTSHRMSRDVDAMLEQVEGTQRSDFPESLLQRTLRPRGLSDSSIRTTFLKDEAKEEPRHGEETLPVTTTPTKLVSSPIAISPKSKKLFGPSQPSSPPRMIPGVRSPSARIGRTLSPWTHLGDTGIMFGSPREESHSAWARRGLESRDI